MIHPLSLMLHSSRTAHMRGYTLLFAVLLTSVIIAVSVSIMNIARKEIVLTGSSRESVIAIAAADSGIECASYYDQTGGGIFLHPTKNDLDTAVVPSYDGFPLCGGLVDVTTSPPVIISSWPTITPDLGYGAGSKAWLYRFYLRPALVSNSNDTRCVVVNVIAGRRLNGSGGYDQYTVIDSVGYNTGYNFIDVNRFNCSIPSANKVERAIHLVY